MKPTLLCAFLLLGFSIYAQEDENLGFQKGDFFISGNIEFSILDSSDDDLETTTFSIIPSAGYFVSDHFAVGARLGYSTVNNETSTIDLTNNSFIIGAFGQYVFTPEKKFSFTGTLALNYINSDVENLEGAESTVDVFQASLAPGIYYFLSKSIAIVSSVGILSYQNFGGDADASSFTLSLNPDNLNFGLLYRF